MLQGHDPIFSCAINLPQRVAASRCPGLIPRRLVKRGVSFRVTVKISQTQAKVVIGLAVIRVRVAACEPFDGLAKMLFRPGKFTPAQMPPTEGVVAAGVARVAA